MMKKKHLKPGFTLVELAITIVIILFIVITVAALTSQALLSSTSFGKSARALNLARIKMEKTLNLEFSQIKNFQEDDYYGSGYQVVREVSYLPGSSESVKKVAVEIIGSSGILFSLSALIADKPPFDFNVSFPVVPVVKTGEADPVRARNARLNMDYDFKDYQSGHLRFRYRPREGSWVYTDWGEASGAGSYFRQVAPLEPGLTYEFQAQLWSVDGLYYMSGEEKTFIAGQ